MLNWRMDRGNIMILKKNLNKVTMIFKYLKKKTIYALKSEVYSYNYFFFLLRINQLNTTFIKSVLILPNVEILPNCLISKFNKLLINCLISKLVY